MMRFIVPMNDWMLDQYEYYVTAAVTGFCGGTSRAEDHSPEDG